MRTDKSVHHFEAVFLKLRKKESGDTSYNSRHIGKETYSASLFCESFGGGLGSADEAAGQFAGR